MEIFTNECPFEDTPKFKLHVRFTLNNSTQYRFNVDLESMENMEHEFTGIANQIRHQLGVW